MLPRVTTREHLLETGRRLFGERAFDEISIDDIAAAAEVSKGLLYHYFEGKRGLYVATLEAEAATLLAETEPDPDELDSGLDAYLDYVEAHRPGWLALMRGGVGSDAEVSSIVEGTRQAIVDRLAATVGHGPLMRIAMREASAQSSRRMAARISSNMRFRSSLVVWICPKALAAR